MRFSRSNYFDFPFGRHSTRWIRRWEAHQRTANTTSGTFGQFHMWFRAISIVIYRAPYDERFRLAPPLCHCASLRLFFAIKGNAFDVQAENGIGKSPSLSSLCRLFAATRIEYSRWRRRHTDPYSRHSAPVLFVFEKGEGKKSFLEINIYCWRSAAEANGPRAFAAAIETDGHFSLLSLL